jgi:hypothetical protein
VASLVLLGSAVRFFAHVISGPHFGKLPVQLSVQPLVMLDGHAVSLPYVRTVRQHTDSVAEARVGAKSPSRPPNGRGGVIRPIGLVRLSGGPFARVFDRTLDYGGRSADVPPSPLYPAGAAAARFRATPNAHHPR